MKTINRLAKRIRKEIFVIFFSFFFTLTACSANSNQLAPNSIKNCEIKYFLEKSQIIDQVNYQIYYIAHFQNNTYTITTNSPLYEEKQEKAGTYTYSKISKTKAKVSSSFINKNGDDVSYVTYLEFEDSNSGIWETSGGLTSPDAEGGSFIIIPSDEEK